MDEEDNDADSGLLFMRAPIIVFNESEEYLLPRFCLQKLKETLR
jgi:hypothetical protein